MNRHLTSQLAAHGHARQVEAALATDRIGAATDRAAGQVRRELLKILRTAREPWVARTAAQRALHQLLPAIRLQLHDGFVKLALQSHEYAARATIRMLPGGYLDAALDSLGHSSPQSWLPGIRSRGLLRRAQTESRSRSAGGLPLGSNRPIAIREDFARDQPGFVQLDVDPTGQFTASDRLAGIEELAPDESRALIQRLLFPPPEESAVRRFIKNLVIGGETWEERLDKAAPWSLNQVANLISQGYSQGKNQREIATMLLPAVDGVRSSARRLARTYGMAVAHQTQIDTAAQLGDLVIGYQVHATLDQWTRPEHRARDGNIYFIQPEPGQLSMSDCPHPPMEADGRPAWNCRCFLTPVLRPLEAISEPGPARDLLLTNRILPDPLTYRDWFAQADAERRRLSVGLRRIQAAQEAIGHTPSYEHFVHPSGELLSPAEIRAESAIARHERVAKVRVEMGRREAAKVQTATFGTA